jgi:hypothetical protein
MAPQDRPTNANLAYAVSRVHAVCCLSGSPSYIQDLREGLSERGIIRAVRNHDTATLFDWLIEIFSLQGISDAVAIGLHRPAWQYRLRRNSRRTFANPVMPQARRVLALL